MLEANLMALQNDLEQAQALANDVQGQLADKTNELGMLKMVWEKAQMDLQKFTQDIQSLRQERHRFAHELQLAEGFRFELERARAESKQLRLDLTTLRHTHRQEIEEMEKKMNALRHLLEQVRDKGATVGGPVGETVTPSRELASGAWQAPSSAPTPPPPPPATRHPSPPSDSEIDIDFLN